MTDRASRYEQSNLEQPHILPLTSGYVPPITTVEARVTDSCVSSGIDIQNLGPQQLRLFGGIVIGAAADGVDMAKNNYSRAHPNEQSPYYRVPGSVSRSLDIFLDETRVDLHSPDTVTRTRAEERQKHLIDTALGLRRYFPEVEIASNLEERWSNLSYDTAAEGANAVVAALGDRLDSLRRASLKTVLPPDADHQNAVRRWNAEVNSQTNAEKPFKRPRNKNKNGI